MSWIWKCDEVSSPHAVNTFADPEGGVPRIGVELLDVVGADGEGDPDVGRPQRDAAR